LTSKRLNRTANECLYESYSCSPYDPPFAFLRSIIGNPELAARVKKLDWKFNMMIPHSSDETSTSDRRLLRENLKQLRIPASERGSWEKLYRNGDMADWLKLAIRLTPNLRELDALDFTPTNYDVPRARYESNYIQCLVSTINNPLMGSLPACHHLHTLRIGMGGMKLVDIYGLFSLPSLRSLDLVAVNAGTSDIPESLSQSRNALSAVTHLQIMQSRVTSEALAVLMNACHGLKHLHVELGSPYDFIPDKVVDYTLLMNALRRHAATLEHFYLDDCARRCGDHFLTRLGELDTFDNFPKLHHLGIPFEAFRGGRSGMPLPFEADLDEDDPVRLCELLPASIRELHLVVYDEEQTELCAESIDSLSSTFNASQARLSNIRIIIRADEEPPTNFTSPRTRFLRGGVGLTIATDFRYLQDDFPHFDDFDDAYEDFWGDEMAFNDLLTVEDMLDTLLDDDMWF
jgi:hypothetical protein